MDTYSDDLSELVEILDLKGVVLIGFSAGGGEVARYIGRHGAKRVAKEEILETRLGHHLLLALSVFWTLRLIEQFVFFDWKNWRSALFSGLFFAGAVIYAVPLVLTR